MDFKRDGKNANQLEPDSKKEDKKIKLFQVDPKKPVILLTDEEKERIANAQKLRALEKAASKRRQAEDQEQVELLEYNKFPTILGWYFDGSFTHNFSLNAEFAEYFQEIDDELQALEDFEIKETFTEKVTRNFWPPKYNGPTFRTRGVYLDLPEVKADPPKPSPPMNFEKQRAIIRVFTGELTNSEDIPVLRFGDMTYTTVHGRKMGLRDKYFWDDELRDFFPKRENEEYDWDPHDEVWVRKDMIYHTPYDWLFDYKQGKFILRDRSKPKEVAYDRDLNIFVKKNTLNVKENMGQPRDPDTFCFDEKEGRWVHKDSLLPNQLELYENGMREIRKFGRGVSGLGPDDFYYDAETGKMEQKKNLSAKEKANYYFDEYEEIWKLKGQSYGPGRSNLYPTDFFFDSKDGVYKTKYPREFKKPSPYDWFVKK